MFTGIVTDIGEVTAREDGRFTIRTRYPAQELEVGASMACDGCCLTMTSVRADASGSVFTVDVSNETRGKTTLGEWQPGRKINLERSLRLGDELGGHIVSGHVDGVARIVDIMPDGESRRFSFEVPEHLAPYIAPERVRCARWRLADRQRGQRQPLRRQPHSPHLDGDDLGGENPRAIGQPRGRPVRALCGAAPGVPSVTHDVGKHAISEGRGFLSSIDEILEDMRNGRMVVLVDAEERENEGDLVIPAQMATPDAINFMAKHGRGLICLTLTRRPRRRARPRSDGADATARATAPPSRSRSRRAKASRPASRRPTARAPSRRPSTRRRAPTTSSRPGTCSRWSRARAAC